MRKFLQRLPPSNDGIEHILLGMDSTPQDLAVVDNKPAKQELDVTNGAQVSSTDVVEKSSMATVNPSLYKNLIIEDLTSAAGPSGKYWEMVAERRRKALEDVLEENNRMQGLISALEHENLSCKELLDDTTDLVNTLKEIINENDSLSDENKSHSDVNETLSDANETLSDDNYLGDSGLSVSDSSSSLRHVHKKIKLSDPDECLN